MLTTATARTAAAALAGLLVLGLTSLVVLPASDADRRETAVPAPEDPFDARHLALELMVAPEAFEVAGVGLGVGVAAGSATSAGPIRVRLLDASGRDLAVLLRPDPLERHIYDLVAGDAGSRTDASGRRSAPAVAAAHETDQLGSAQLQVALPLDPRLALVVVERVDSDGAVIAKARVDVVDALAATCGRDDHRDCRAWEAAH